MLRRYTVTTKAGIELNLVTLKINDKEVYDDYTSEKILKQNEPVFWINMFYVLFNLSFNWNDYFQGGAFTSFNFLRGGLTFVWTVALYAIFYFKC